MRTSRPSTASRRATAGCDSARAAPSRRLAPARHAARTALLVATAAAALACSGGADEVPRPTSVEPSSGAASAPVRLTIRGDGFLALPSTKQDGSGAAVDTTHRAWLGDTELEAVTWIDVHTLQATAPAGMPAGSKRLVVQNALGKRGALDAAYEVIGARSAVLEATLSAAPSTVSVGQPITVTLAVRNTGGSAATGVAPATLSVGGAGGAGATVTGPSPASLARLEPGASTSFTWSVVPAAPGAISLSNRAQGVDTLTSAGVSSLTASATAQAQLPAELTATIAASPTTVNVGQAVTATFTLTNGGATTANVTKVTPSTSGATATCGAVSPAPTAIPAGGTSTFTWTCTASASGTLALSGTATGTEAGTGASLSVTPAVPATVAVQTKAALTASLAVQGAPTTVAVGQVLQVTLTVSDTGQAGATLQTVQATASPTAAASCTDPSPTPPQTVAGLGTRTFTWACTVQAAGNLSLGATVSGTDANTGAAVQATAPAIPLTAVLPANLTATIAAAPATVSVGQQVTAIFTVTNGGTSSANLTAFTPSTTGTATFTCDPSTFAPGSLAPNATATFGWTCITSAPGTLSFTGTVVGTDALSGQDLSATPAAPATVSVQTPAALTASLQAPTPTADTGQAIAVSLVLSNTGEASASVTAVTVTATGSASCTASTPVPPSRTVPGLGTLTLSFSCTDAVAEVVTISAAVTAADANSGADVSPAVAPIDVTWTALTATLTRSPDAATVPPGTVLAVTLSLVNDRQTTAHVAKVTPTKTGKIACDPLPAGQVPLDVAAGANATVGWSCTANDTGTLGANVTATDLDTGASLTVTVQAISVTVL